MLLLLSFEVSNFPVCSRWHVTGDFELECANICIFSIFSFIEKCFTLLLDTLQTTVKYVIHLGDLSRQGPCESRRTVQYYTEFVTDSMILVTTLGHYLHIMVRGVHNIFFCSPQSLSLFLWLT